MKFSIDSIEEFRDSLLDFLSAFGAGNATPGCGSAGSLSAIWGIELLQSVCKITSGKESFDHNLFETIQNRLEDVKLKLGKVFITDSVSLEDDLEISRRARVEKDLHKREIAEELSLQELV